jgi:hypothetical protein
MQVANQILLLAQEDLTVEGLSLPEAERTQRKRTSSHRTN